MTNTVIRGQVNFYDNNTGITTCELKQLLKKPQLQNSQNHENAAECESEMTDQNDKNSQASPSGQLHNTDSSLWGDCSVHYKL